jgi:hypothetical protein
MFSQNLENCNTVLYPDLSSPRKTFQVELIVGPTLGLKHSVKSLVCMKCLTSNPTAVGYKINLGPRKR